VTIRVLGIDPGLTRCGVGVVDVEPDRRVTLVYYGVVRSEPSAPIEERLLTVNAGLEALIDEHEPHAMAVERVFAQHNLRTVMGTAQVSGLALRAAAARSIPVGLRTPSEVKAAITGYGAADKKQVQAMVARVLRLAEPPQPADAADALALAICHAWRGAAPDARAMTGSSTLTPAQRAWLAAERGTKR
jgi:crossover junction endodeoxyribonuclease RuvC